MWIDNAVFKEDMEYVSACKSVDWDNLANKTILVTGATGLIGSTIVSALIYANNTRDLNLHVIALVRDQNKAEKQFAKQVLYSDVLSFVEGSVENLPAISLPIDYIIHGASPTSSTFFIEHPVETINISVQGTTNLLNLAVKKAVKGFVYLSSMEVYGAPQSDDIITESQGTTIDTMLVRSSYPEAKRLCECLCASYASQYDICATVVRLAQTFGPGVDVNDNRVFAEFARCAMNKQNIELQTAGTSKRCYLYTADAATAILTVLTKGEAGNAYNAANPDTYCSIVEMANMIAKEISNGKIKVCVPSDGKHEKKFSPPHNLNLNVRKIEHLGWRCSTYLKDMYTRMLIINIEGD